MHVGKAVVAPGRSGSWETRVVDAEKLQQLCHATCSGEPELAWNRAGGLGELRAFWTSTHIVSRFGTILANMCAKIMEDAFGNSSGHRWGRSGMGQ